MAVVTLFSTSYSHGNEIATAAAERLNYRLIGDDELLRQTSDRFRVSEPRLRQALGGFRSLWDQLARTGERRVAYLRATLVNLIEHDRIVYHGLAGHLLGGELPHVLRVCVVSKRDARAVRAADARGTSPRAARRTIAREDQEIQRRTADLLGLTPFDKSLYDVFVPIDDMAISEAVELICASVARPAVRTSEAALAALEDFRLTCAVYVALAEAGLRHIRATSKRGRVTASIDRYVVRLQHLKDEIAAVALAVPGVVELDVTVGPNFRPPDIYGELDLPPKILLVDDEKEFVLTLSQRLHARNFPSAVAYDGEQALAMVDSEAPDVMVLDLKMPGIDGLEVLRRVKKKNPATEVIILTGHGSSAEEKAAAQLGAFAYLNKPVDIDRLSAAMKAAYDKINASRRGQRDPDDPARGQADGPNHDR